MCAIVFSEGVLVDLDKPASDAAPSPAHAVTASQNVHKRFRQQQGLHCNIRMTQCTSTIPKSLPCQLLVTVRLQLGQGGIRSNRRRLHQIFFTTHFPLRRRPRVMASGGYQTKARLFLCVALEIHRGIDDKSAVGKLTAVSTASPKIDRVHGLLSLQ